MMLECDGPDGDGAVSSLVKYGAVTVENLCAKVDYDKCVGCGKCHEACPVKCIDVIEPGVKITETKVN